MIWARPCSTAVVAVAPPEVRAMEDSHVGDVELAYLNDEGSADEPF